MIYKKCIVCGIFYEENKVCKCGFDEIEVHGLIVEYYKQGLSNWDIFLKLGLNGKRTLSFINSYLRSLNFKPNPEKYNFKCKMCGKQSISNSPNSTYCSEECGKKYRREYERKKYHKRKKVRNINKIFRKCLYCKTEFEIKKVGQKQIFCSDECSKKYDEPTIENIREEFRNLSLSNPFEAQKIADEMEVVEGKEFRELVLNGLPPFSKKEHDEHNA